MKKKIWTLILLMLFSLGTTESMEKNTLPEGRKLAINEKEIIPNDNNQNTMKAKEENNINRLCFGVLKTKDLGLPPIGANFTEVQGYKVFDRDTNVCGIKLIKLGMSGTEDIPYTTILESFVKIARDRSGDILHVNGLPVEGGIMRYLDGIDEDTMTYGNVNKSHNGIIIYLNMDSPCLTKDQVNSLKSKLDSHHEKYLKIEASSEDNCTIT